MSFRAGFKEGCPELIREAWEGPTHEGFARFGSLKGRVVCVGAAALGLCACSVTPFATPFLMSLGLTLGAIGWFKKSRTTKEVSGFVVGFSLGLPIAAATLTIKALAGIIHPKAFFCPAADTQLKAFFTAIDDNQLNASANLKRKCRLIFSNFSLQGLESVYRHAYRKMLLEIEEAFAQKGEGQLGDSKKREILKELDDAFEHCVPGWGASLEKICAELHEPNEPMEKVSFWVDNLKRGLIQGMATELSRYENRNLYNGMIELIGDDIGLKSQVSERDSIGWVHLTLHYGIEDRQVDADELLNVAVKQDFYAKLTESLVKEHLRDIINSDERSAVRLGLLEKLSELDKECAQDEDPGTAVSIKYTQSKFDQRFNDAAFTFLARIELKKLRGYLIDSLPARRQPRPLPKPPAKPLGNHRPANACGGGGGVNQS